MFFGRRSNNPEKRAASQVSEFLGQGLKTLAVSRLCKALVEADKAQLLRILVACQQGGSQLEGIGGAQGVGWQEYQCSTAYQFDGDDLKKGDCGPFVDVIIRA